MKTIPSGVYPTMITPYTADNKIDFEAVKKMLHFYHERGVAGVFAICQSSEIFFLSFEERLELIKFIMEKKPEGMAVVASGHTADDLETQIKEAKAFIETGIDAYVFISNRFAKADEDDDVLLKNMEYVANSLPDIPLGVYECPYPYKRLLSPYVLKKMGETGRYCFIKDKCCNRDEIKIKLDAIEGSGIKLYNANAATLLESLRMGCDGFSGVMANFHPELYSELCSCYKDEPEKAEKIQDFVGFASLAECQCYPVNAKYHYNLVGIDMCIDSRARDKAGFGYQDRIVIEEMHRSVELFKKNIL